MCSTVVFGFLLVVALAAAAAAVLKNKDYLVRNTLPDGENELRIKYRGFYAKETTVGKGRHHGVKYREVSNGKQLLQLIYDENDDLKDCEIVHEPHEVTTFLNAFQRDIDNLVTTSNLTIHRLDSKPLPRGIKIWFRYPRLRKLCRKKQLNVKNKIRERKWEEIKEKYAADRSQTKRTALFIMPGTLWCGHSSATRSYTDLGTFYNTDSCCRRHDYCRTTIPGNTNKFNYYNSSPFTLSHCQCDTRGRRDLADIFRVPGTKWCGKGYSAGKYTQLGGFSRTDRCCRRHDTTCPFWIAGFQTKYGLLNWRINTIMHCSCDERFRACLKMVDTSDANLVGKLFFNVVQTKCFILKPKKVCTKYTLWGKCEKRRYVKQAVLRDNIPY